MGANAGYQRRVEQAGGAVRFTGRQQPRSCRAGRPALQTSQPSDRNCEQECEAKSSDAYDARGVARARKATDDARRGAVEQLDRVRYFHRQASWLTERFPEGELGDVEGLVKLVDRAEIEANDWSLTPGRYVGVAPEEEDENFDFKEACARSTLSWRTSTRKQWCWRGRSGQTSKSWGYDGACQGSY